MPALITLIEKKDKDKRYIKNWRPKPLINVDAKVASEVLSSRMRNVLASIVNCDQTAYVKGRYIGESIRLINDILEHTEENNSEAILFSADLRNPLIQWNIHLFLLLLKALVPDLA